MKIFYTIQKQYALLGICSLPQSTKNRPFHHTAVHFNFVSLTSVIVSQFLYTFRESIGFMEYIEEVCAAAGSIIIFICLAAIVSRKTTLFNGIDNFE